MTELIIYVCKRSTSFPWRTKWCLNWHPFHHNCQRLNPTWQLGYYATCSAEWQPVPDFEIFWNYTVWQSNMDIENHHVNLESDLQSTNIEFIYFPYLCLCLTDSHILIFSFARKQSRYKQNEPRIHCSSSNLTPVHTHRRKMEVDHWWFMIVDDWQFMSPKSSTYWWWFMMIDDSLCLKLTWPVATFFFSIFLNHVPPLFPQLFLPPNQRKRWLASPDSGRLFHQPTSWTHFRCVRE